MVLVFLSAPIHVRPGHDDVGLRGCGTRHRRSAHRRRTARKPAEFADLVMVSAAPMGVPMCQLIFRGITYFRNFDIKRQIHASQGFVSYTCKRTFRSPNTPALPLARRASGSSESGSKLFRTPNLSFSIAGVVPGTNVQTSIPPTTSCALWVSRA